MKNETFICSHCGAVHPLTGRVLCEGDSLCPDCADLLTIHCDHCGTCIYLDHAVCDTLTTLCPSCYESHYTTCFECGTIIPTRDAYYADDDDEPYCYTCYQKLEDDSSIHPYDYRPEPVFYGDGMRYLGVELEIDDGGTSVQNAKKLLSIANRNAEHLYIKTDGSLDCGLELVTHPMSLDYHLHHMPWAELLQAALACDYRSHQTGTCGLHVHISRDAFGSTYHAQELAIARLLYFVEKFWSELLRFSRRTERQINRWATRYGLQLSPKAVMETAKDSHAGRYTAINLTNRNTIEIRIFRGTLRLNTLFATLQLVNAMCDAALFLSDEELQLLSWHDFLDRLHEPELIQYLKERNLYKNEPIVYEEES